LADVHIDYVAYMRMLIHHHTGLFAFMRKIDQGWSASRTLFERLMRAPQVQLQPGAGLVNVPNSDAVETETADELNWIV
jgi:hypothetical protein